MLTAQLAEGVLSVFCNEIVPLAGPLTSDDSLNSSVTLKYKVCGIVFRKDKTGSRLMADNFLKNCYILVKNNTFRKKIC
jgi:hypothetical protein